MSEKTIGRMIWLALMVAGIWIVLVSLACDSTEFESTPITSIEPEDALGKIGNGHPYLSFLYVKDNGEIHFSVCDPPTVDPISMSKTESTNPPVRIWWKSNAIVTWASRPTCFYQWGWCKQTVAPPAGGCQRVILIGSTNDEQYLPTRLYLLSGGRVNYTLLQPKQTY